MNNGHQPVLRSVESWFSSRGWQPFEFQRTVWDAYLKGESGLVHAPTGMGKSYAVWMGPLIEGMTGTDPGGRDGSAEGLKVLWITPLRALAADTATALRLPVSELGLPWTVETRTGDTSSTRKALQRKRLPDTLITTPESLSLLISYPDARQKFSRLEAVVVDEWHELLSTKRGVQTELALARLRRWCPSAKIWGLSATLGNLDVALATLLGPEARTQGRIIRGLIPKQVDIECLIPKSIERFPWAGHLGVRLLDVVLNLLESSRSTLLFANTRSQTEIWFQAIIEARPEWGHDIALHHGSVDRQTRSEVEDSLREGRLRCVVCTSSLDLGVDFTPVDLVLQVGSPKGIARLLQRAGRSGHGPSLTSRVVCVPTHALELIEVAAARTAARAGKIETRLPLQNSLDVLAQHLITIAAGGGFGAEALLDEVRSTHAFQCLSDTEWNWVLDFVTRGGSSLRAYEEYKKVVWAGDEFQVRDERVAKRHRMSIGTITSDSAVSVRFLSGKRLGTIEESFISRLRSGEFFVFAGRTLEFVRMRELTAWVRKAPATRATIPRWMGSKMPLSTELAQSVREKLDEARRGLYTEPEMLAVRPLLELQKCWSAIPGPDELLVERTRSREGYHLFFFPFQGRLVHEGLSALLAYRLSRLKPLSFSLSVNDYGFELLSPTDFPFDGSAAERILTPQGLAEDLRASLNAVEMARQQFREIARVAGLVFQGYPGSLKTTRQLQISTSLLYDVFRNYEPDNLFLRQAEHEVFEKQLEGSRLQRSLELMQSWGIVMIETERFSPFAFPLMANRLRQKLSSEAVEDRIRRMTVKLERVAGAASGQSR